MDQKDEIQSNVTSIRDAKKKVAFDELADFLGGECGSRCMDDDEDVEATVLALLQEYTIYKKRK